MPERGGAQLRLPGATRSGVAAGSPLAQPVISVRGLTKHYGETHAVRGIDLEVSRGEIFAFLGPNGAGKTTTVEILEGFRRPTDGWVRVLDVDPVEADGAWRNRVGVVLQESAPEPGLTVRECLQLYAGYYRAPATSKTPSPWSAWAAKPTPSERSCRAASGGGSTLPWP